MSTTGYRQTRPDLLSQGPGACGYLLAIAVSAAAFSVLLGGFDGLGPGVVVLYLIVLVVALPVGGAGALIVEMTCGRVRQQWVHVLAAACSAYVIVFFVLGYFAVVTFSAPGPELLGVVAWTATPMAVSAAVGRAAVVPIARRRDRERRAPVAELPS